MEEPREKIKTMSGRIRKYIDDFDIGTASDIKIKRYIQELNIMMWNINLFGKSSLKLKNERVDWSDLKDTFTITPIEDEQLDA